MGNVPLPDPDGSRRAELLARMEYNINPRGDGRQDVAYSDRPGRSSKVEPAVAR